MTRVLFNGTYSLDYKDSWPKLIQLHRIVIAVVLHRDPSPWPSPPVLFENAESLTSGASPSFGNPLNDNDVEEVAETGDSNLVTLSAICVRDEVEPNAGISTL